MTNAMISDTYFGVALRSDDAPIQGYFNAATSGVHHYDVDQAIYLWTKFPLHSFRVLEYDSFGRDLIILCFSSSQCASLRQTSGRPLQGRVGGALATGWLRDM